MGPKWDDLDLVRYAINKRGISSKYHSFSVVYCDEAQDFTKIETDLILKLLVHSKYDLTQHLGDDKIPVAFAGDPNQTINPTGFRWGSMQEIFTRSFEESLGDFRGLEAEMLEINYRSHEGVVKFANAIQFLRHRLLSDSKQKLTLQRAWNSDDDTSSQDTSEMSYVAYYSLDKYRPQIMAGMQKAIILTSDEGEYSPIDRDMENEPESFEKHLWKTTETRKSELGLPEDVANSRLYTAMTAKGLEFKGVILYRFSSDPAINLFESLIQGTQTLTDSDLYKLAHFFTKLYIAISRAKQVLFVVDTDHGYDKFWRYFIEPELWEHYIAPKIEQSRANDVNRLSMGNIADFATLLSENFNPKELADYYYRTALEEESKDTMNRALSCYAMAKYYDRVDHCKAHILLFDKEYVKAGRQFVELLEYQNALEAFWRGKCWDMVITTIQDMGAAGMSMEMRRLIARYMRGDIKVDVFLDKCLQVEDALHENVISNRDLWHEILQKTENEANRLDDLSLSATFMSNLSSFSRYFQSYDNGMQSLRALLHYRKGIFKNVGNTVAIKDTDLLEAIRLWTAKGDINRKEYYTAKKLTATDTSDEIRWMSRLGESQSIIDRFGTPEASLILNDEARGIVFSILLQRDYQAAINYPHPKDLYVKWQRLFTHNHSAFLSLVVLSGYDTKAFDFLETQITEADKPIDVLSPEIFEKIFALREVHGGAPYWTRFVRLTNKDGFRAFFNEQNSTIALDVLSNKLCENAEYDKDMASCFLEVLFGKNFSLRRAEKYHAAFLRIFGKDVFFKEDFRNATRRNKYFSEYITVSNEELDLIKDNVRKYIQYKFESTKKAAKNNETEIQTMVKAYEICVPYQATSPDYAHIVSMLNRWIKDSKFSRIKPWLSTRAALNRLLSDAIEQRASYTSFKKHIDEIGITLTEAVQDFSREDAVAFIAAVFQNPEYDFDLMVMVARLLHGRRLQRENFRTLCNVNTLAVNISTYVRTALQEELSRPRLNVPVVKWLTFTWESILDNASAAENYDLFLRDNRRRLSRMGKLKDYLMRRALLHYSTMAASLFEAKKDEYNISMTKEYLPAKFPEIGDKTDDTPSTEPIEDKPMDPEKESQLDMAKQLKALGNTAQQIAPLLKLLTIEEIEYL